MEGVNGWAVKQSSAVPCLLCGDTTDVAMALAHWRDGTYSAITRCKDVDACQRRVEATGAAWELDDMRAPR